MVGLSGRKNSRFLSFGDKFVFFIRVVIMAVNVFMVCGWGLV